MDAFGIFKTAAILAGVTTAALSLLRLRRLLQEQASRQVEREARQAEREARLAERASRQAEREAARDSWQVQRHAWRRSLDEEYAEIPY